MAFVYNFLSRGSGLPQRDSLEYKRKQRKNCDIISEELDEKQ